jgi:hypothetical protein
MNDPLRDDKTYPKRDGKPMLERKENNGLGNDGR